MDESSLRHERGRPWNKGKLLGQKAPLKVSEVWAIRVRLQLTDRARDLSLLDLAIDSKLRSCDLVVLRVRDILHGDHVAPRAVVMQRKTRRPVQFEITDLTRRAVAYWVTRARTAPGRLPVPKPLSAIRAHLDSTVREDRQVLDT